MANFAQSAAAEAGTKKPKEEAEAAKKREQSEILAADEEKAEAAKAKKDAAIKAAKAKTFCGRVKKLWNESPERVFGFAAVVLLAASLIALGLILVLGLPPFSNAHDNNPCPESKSVGTSATETFTVTIPGFVDTHTSKDGDLVDKHSTNQGNVAEVQVPDAILDKLAPPCARPTEHNGTGLAAPGVASIAAGVSILVALISLSGIWTQVKRKWVDDQLNDVWERFTWVVDKSRARFLDENQRAIILTALREKASTLDDPELYTLINEWLTDSVNKIFSTLKDYDSSTQSAALLLTTVIDDKSLTSATRKKAQEALDELRTDKGKEAIRTGALKASAVGRNDSGGADPGQCCCARPCFACQPHRTPKRRWTPSLAGRHGGPRETRSRGTKSDGPAI